MAMKFNKLTIERSRWGEDVNKITATLEIEGATGEMKLILPQSAGTLIMQACSEIVATEGAKRAAEFSREFIESVNAPTIQIEG